MPAGLIGSVLIANRGEIACRIIRTARRMGIRTVAVYSDADAKALHVRQADEAVHIGSSPARESYLVGERIIAAAKETGAEAIHPGYGFLSENADFAQAVTDAGLIWVGPRPDSIRAMGLKDAAKKLMAEAGVPVTPGYLGEDQDPKRLQKEAEAIGWPVLIKAVAGGGGKGMRRVNAADEFAEMLLSCKREAASSFGDDRVLIEKYIERPRHIEVQVFGDTHGNIVHLFERDCSLQRRHQKVIEEAPAPGMDEATRAAVCAAAVKAARAVDYVGAGTVEFIADASEGLRADRIWFMEMNTRLQVEHPVTEEITGQDLVEWQLRVASGEKLPRAQDEIAIDGWAMEARLYAEDPGKGFLPSTGRLDYFEIGESDLARIDTGVGLGSEISPFYDPMIAKIITHGRTREGTARTLRTACHNTIVAPVKTNAAFLANCLAHPDFRSGEIDTGFIHRHEGELVPPAAPSRAVIEVAAMAVLHDEMGDGDSVQLWRYESRKEPQPFPGSAWRSLAGFRLNGPSQMRIALTHDGQSFVVERPVPKEARLSTIVKGDQVLVAEAGQSYLFTRERATGAAGSASGDGAIISPMPGKLIAVDVRPGDPVTKGQKLVTLEAMKMEHSLVAPFDGIVAELNASEGAQVSEGTLLVRIEKGEGVMRLIVIPAQAGISGRHGRSPRDPGLRRGDGVTVVPGRYYEQWTLGDSIRHQPHRTVTETDNLLISALTHNPQPLHLDETYAEATEFGRIVVNGTFTFALLVGLSVGDTTLGTLVANLGYDKVRMPKPVFIGDTLRAETEVVGLKDSNSRPEAGIVTFEHRMYNQRDELVCVMERTALMQRRGA